MGMGDEHEIQFGHFKLGKLPVFQVGVASTLEHPAIDQEIGRSRIEQVTRAGDFARGAIKAEFHKFIQVVFMDDYERRRAGRQWYERAGSGSGFGARYLGSSETSVGTLMRD